ncbi:MAG: GTP-binding protein, partial [Treponema sp.]|nr:GTP-binding protein [Treponema sp.]
MSFTTDRIKNVAIAGHGGTGKTTLFERLLFAGKSLPKPETVESGKTVGDSTPEEIERKISIHAALAHVEWLDRKINLFDTPGSSDFIGDVILAFRASEFVLLAVDGRSAVQIETVKLWRNLEGRKKPRGFLVTKLDEERADFDKTLADFKEKFKVDPAPLTLPMGSGPSFAGVIDVLHEKAWLVDQGGGLEKEGPIPGEYQEQVAAARERLIEAAAEGDDALMERYIDSGSLEAEEIRKGLVEALADNKIVVVFAGAALKNSGLVPFLDFAAEISPGPGSAKDRALDGEGKEQEVSIDPDKPLSGLVLKTAYDQFSGKLSWVKVITGKLSAETEALNVSENKKERIGKLYACQGKKLEEVKELYAGDVGIVSKSPTLKTNDTISAVDAGLSFLPLRFPEPVHSVAVNAAAKKDDDKLGEFLVRAAEED